MKKIVKLLLITATMVPLIFISIKSYSATEEVDVAIIDTDFCTACGDCLEAQSMWVVDDCGYGFVFLKKRNEKTNIYSDNSGFILLYTRE